VNELQFALLASALAVACLVAAVAGRRAGNDRRDVRLMLAGGAALGGVALILLAFWNTP
jgi:hypothetical protein